MGLYSEAVDMMQRAVQVSGALPLAWRACGVMTYLYDSGQGHKERSLVSELRYIFLCVVGIVVTSCFSVRKWSLQGYFHKAYVLSEGMDFEAGRLKAQVTSSHVVLRSS